jgi:integrase
VPKLSSVKLTKRTVEAAEVAPSVVDGRFFWDSEVRGFGLRVYPTGRKLFVFQYQSPGEQRTRRLTLGAFPALTAETARRMALDAAGSVAKGTDPKGGKTDGREKKTLADVFPDYLAEREGKVAERTSGEYQRLWERTLSPDFGTKRVSAVTEEMVAKWHSARRKTPTLANRAVDLLSSFLSWAERRGYRPKHSNPCVEVERFPESRQSRSLTADEYQVLGSAIRAAAVAGLAAPPVLQKQKRGMSRERRAKLTGRTRKQPIAPKAPFLLPASPALSPANPTALAALRFLILTGWREQEVLSLRWDAVNLERGVAVLAVTKTGRSERPLGKTSIKLLESLPRVKDNPHVFPGKGEKSHIADLKRVWLSVKHGAQLEKTSRFRLHDLRHSFTTVARDELGFGDHVIARLVGHRLEGMTSRYGEIRDRTLRAAADAITAQIVDFLGTP